MRSNRPAAKAFLEALAKSRAKKVGIPGSGKPKKRRPGNESPRVTAALKVLKLKGYFAWRANSGNHVIEAQGSHARALVRGAPAGTPDILLVLPRDVLVPRRGVEAFDPALLGMLCGIEMKTESGRQSASQKAWEAAAKAKGVRYGIATNVAEVLTLVAGWERGMS
jgi:hypothetical protein